MKTTRPLVTFFISQPFSSLLATYFGGLNGPSPTKPFPVMCALFILFVAELYGVISYYLSMFINVRPLKRNIIPLDGFSD